MVLAVYSCCYRTKRSSVCTHYTIYILILISIHFISFHLNSIQFISTDHRHRPSFNYYVCLVRACRCCCCCCFFFFNMIFCHKRKKKKRPFIPMGMSIWWFELCASSVQSKSIKFDAIRQSATTFSVPHSLIEFHHQGRIRRAKKDVIKGRKSFILSE